MLLLLLACRAPAEPIDTGVDEPTPYIYEDDQQKLTWWLDCN